MRSLRCALALFAVLVSSGVMSSTPAQAASSGVVINGPTGLTQQTDGQLAGLGVGWVRAFAAWNIFEPNHGHLNEPEMATLETGIAGLPAGTKVIVDVVDAPQWETGSSNPTTPPRNPGDYAAFIGTIARRLAGRVAAYEIWNEEDASLWWATGPDPAAYAALLRGAYAAVKAADPNAEVVLGGLTGNDYEYLAQLYDHGAKGSFDAVAVHTDSICDVISPYEYLRNDPRGAYPGQINRWAFLGYRTVHEVMLAHGDSSPIWMTELGWSTYSGVCNAGAWAGKKEGGVSPQQQATFLLQAYHCLAQDPYVQVGIWFGLQDTEPFDSPRRQYGLLDSSLAPKPAYGALSEYAHSGDRLTEPCGNFNGPTITLVHPKRNAHYTGTLPITVRASDPFGVHQISLYDDGRIIRNFTAHPAVPTLTGRMVWWGAWKIRPGRHVLTVKAEDEKGNATTASFVIYHGVAHRRHNKRRRPHRHR
jgi:polysaccharide biosynthesis protein PslG